MGMDEQFHATETEEQYHMRMDEEGHDDLTAETWNAKNTLISAIRADAQGNPILILNNSVEIIHALFWWMRLELGESWSAKMQEEFIRLLSRPNTEGN